MNTVTIAEKSFQIPDYGINYSDTCLKITVILGDASFSNLETAVKNIGETIDIYDAEGKEKTGTFNGYTKLVSLAKKYCEANSVEITLEKPTLENAVQANSTDILTLQETVAELYAKVGE